MRLTRKTYFVNPRLQLQLIFAANVLALISVAMMTTLVFYNQSHIDSYMAILNLPKDHPFLVAAAQRHANFLYMCVLIGIVQFAIFNATAIFVSHRIAGPLYRLERHLADVGSGKEPTDVKFRKGDLYQHLAEACNKVMARLRNLPANT